MRYRHGFTLVEVLVALAILIVGVVAVMQLYPHALRQSRAASERTVVSEMANSRLQRIRAEGAERLFKGLATADRIYQAAGLYQSDFLNVQALGGGDDVYLQRVTYTVQMADGRLETFVTYVARQ